LGPVLFVPIDTKRTGPNVPSIARR